LSSQGYPPKGAQARRIKDGLAGTVFLSSPKTDLVAVRWQGKDGTGTLLYSAEHFARDWELTKTGAQKWHARAGVVALLVLCAGIAIYGGVRAWESIAAGRSQAATRRQGSAGTGTDANSLHDDGALAAQACSLGADAFVRSVAGDGYKWAYGATRDEKFNDEVAVHVAPGITTSVSDKLLIEDSTGVFRRVELVCSFDSEENAVLKYWIADSGE
jgi:hypothetical protein